MALNELHVRGTAVAGGGNNSSESVLGTLYSTLGVQIAETKALIHKVEQLYGADRTRADALLKRLKLYIPRRSSSQPPQTTTSRFAATLQTGRKRPNSSPDAEEMLRRMNRDKKMKQWEKKQRERLAVDDEWICLPSGVYTTAKPRPKMYITWKTDLQPQLVSYGAHAPFNPLTPGANMSHKPVFKPADEGFSSIRVVQAPRQPISAAAAT